MASQAMKQAASQSKDARVQALAAATTALAAKNAYDSVAPTGGVASGVTISATYGESKSHSETQSSSSTTTGSLVKAGENVTIRATESDLNVVGSTIEAGNDASLTAARNLNLTSGENTSQQTGRSSGSSWGVGVAATYGSQGWAAGVTANASVSKGRSNGADLSHTNTQVIAGNKAALASGQDTTLKGATVAGKQVTADVGGNLAIESQQDTSTYQSKDQSLGGSVTVGIGFAASVNASRQRMASEYASVTQQSGIQAGDDGFQVNVKGNTDLKGASIASSEKAVTDQKNTLTTGTLTQSAIQNKADYDADSLSLGASMSRSGQGSAKNVQTFDNKQGATAPMAMSAEGDDSSTTRSGVSGATITLTDAASRPASEQAIAGLDRTVTTGEDRTNSLKNNFSAQEIQAGFDVTKAFGQEVGTFLTNKAAKVDSTKKTLEEECAKDEPDFTRIKDLTAQLKADATWAPGGTSRQVLMAISAAANGNVTGSSSLFVQNAMVSFIQQKGAAYIGELVHTGKLTEGSPEQAALHAIVAAAGSAASGQDVLSGSAGAAASSLLTNLLDSPGQTEVEKEANRNLLLTLVAGMTDATGGDATSADNSAMTALDNNGFLSWLNQPSKNEKGNMTMYQAWKAGWYKAKKQLDDQVQAMKDELIKKDRGTFGEQESKFQGGVTSAHGTEYERLTALQNEAVAMDLVMNEMKGWMEAQNVLDHPITFEDLNRQALKTAWAKNTIQSSTAAALMAYIGLTQPSNPLRAQSSRAANSGTSGYAVAETEEVVSQTGKTSLNEPVSGKSGTQAELQTERQPTNGGSNGTTTTFEAQYENSPAQTAIDDLTHLFDKGNPLNKLSIEGQPILEGVGGNKIGTTKVLDSQNLTDQQIHSYAQKLAGGQMLKRVAPGVYEAPPLPDGTIIKLRSVSSSQATTGARWTIDIVDNPPLKMVKPTASKFELKFR